MVYSLISDDYENVIPHMNADVVRIKLIRIQLVGCFFFGVVFQCLEYFA